MLLLVCRSCECGAREWETLLAMLVRRVEGVYMYTIGSNVALPQFLGRPVTVNSNVFGYIATA